MKLLVATILLALIPISSYAFFGGIEKRTLYIPCIGVINGHYILDYPR